MIPFYNIYNNLLRNCLRHSSYGVRWKSSLDKKLILYGDEASPPVRFVMMTASILGIEYKFHKIDLFSSDNKSEFFTKINALQKVPALAVGEDIICDSHAIALYLCGLSDNDTVYPKTSLIRAQIDQMLFFNSGLLFPIDSAIYSDFFTGKWPVDENKVKDWYYLLDYLEHRLSKHPWLAGEKMYLCDICCGATISSLQLLVPPTDRHEKVNEWMKRLEDLPVFDINTRGLTRLNVFVQNVKSIL